MNKSAQILGPTHLLVILIAFAWLGAAYVSPARAGGISVSTVNGQTTIRFNGKEVFSGPTKGNVRGYSSNINGEEFAAAFEGDAVLWENTPGAARKVKRNSPNLPRPDPNMFPEGFNFNTFMTNLQAMPMNPMFPEGFNFNEFKRSTQWQGGGGFNHSGLTTIATSSMDGQTTSISTRTVNGQTIITAGTNRVFSGHTSGSVSVKTEVRDGVPRILVMDGGQVIYDSVNPVDEFSEDNNPGPKLPKGLLSPEGTGIRGEVLSSDSTQLLFHHLGGLEESVPLTKIAAILFRPLPESKRATLIRPEPGLLLRTGDYVEGQVKSIQDGKVEISSVLFGLKSYDTSKEAVALILRKLAPEFASQKKDNPDLKADR